MLKSVKSAKQDGKDKYRIPRKVQDLIAVNRIWEDGIFLSGKRFSMSYRITDINYQVAAMDGKRKMFEQYCAVLNGLDSSASAKITVNTHRMNRSDYEGTVLMELRNDQLDIFREEYNDVIMHKALSDNGMVQGKYITISCARRSIHDARVYFKRITAELEVRLAELGSRCEILDAVERLKILHNFYRPQDSDRYRFSLRHSMRWGHDFRDYICPDHVEKHSDYLKMGDRYVRTLYLKDLASFIRDDIVDELTNQKFDTMLSIDVLPVPTEEAVREVERKLLGVEKNITDWQRRQNANNNFSATIPYDMEQQRKESKDFLEDLTARDQRMMLCVITLVITADSKKELDSRTDAIKSIAQNRMCQIATLNYQQTDALNTVLPIGPRKINAFRTLNTESLAVFMPFKVQEIQEKGGMYYGENKISHNLILCNKEKLMNQSSFLLGVPGSGKSFYCKLMILNLILNTKDDILICDPEGEYAPMVNAMAGIGSVIHIAAGGHDHLNAMYMVDGYGDKDADPVVVKSQFVMSLVEQIDKHGVGPQQKSIIDRCVRAIYKDGKENNYMPTLSTLRAELLRQPEPQATEIALSLELFTDGSLDIFGHESNVNLNKRVTVFDIHGLGSQLKPTGLLVITDTMINRVTQNWKRGRRTHVILDEFHVVFENAFSAEFFTSAWRQFRKRNAYPTAITQNVEYLLDSVQASTMLSNSEFVVMLNQAASDRDKLAKLLNISQEQLGYITNVEPGSGLIKYGSALVPFTCQFPKNTTLYQLMTTRPGEGYFAKLQS